MATGNVAVTHVSGGLLSADLIPDRLHCKIGQAETGEANRPYLISNYNQARDIFGSGELSDSIRQHFEEFNELLGQSPVPVLAVRAENDSAGSVASPVLTGTGSAAAPTVTGTPTGSRTVKLKFTKAGAHGTAEYRKSVDGGLTYGTPLVTPASGSPISLDVGVTASFVNAGTPSATFAAGDIWTFTITGPGATLASRLAALQANMRNYRAYWFHILGESTRAFAVSVDSVLASMASLHHHPTFGVLEGRKKSVGETVPAYFASLMEEWDPFYSDRLSIISAEGRYIPGGIASLGGFALAKENTSVGEWRNAATMLCTKLSASAPNISAGYVKLMRSLTFAEIRYWNEGYRDYMDSMHDMRLTVLKEYDDNDGIYIAKDRIKSKYDSDFAEIPERRRADKMHRIVYKESLPFLNADTEVKNSESGLESVKVNCDAAVARQMEVPGQAEINSHKITLDPDKSFARTKLLKARLTMYVAGRIDGISWETNFGTAGQS